MPRCWGTREICYKQTKPKNELYNFFILQPDRHLARVHFRGDVAAIAQELISWGGLMTKWLGCIHLEQQFSGLTPSWLDHSLPYSLPHVSCLPLCLLTAYHQIKAKMFLKKEETF